MRGGASRSPADPLRVHPQGLPKPVLHNLLHVLANAANDRGVEPRSAGAFLRAVLRAAVRAGLLPPDALGFHQSQFGEDI